MLAGLIVFISLCCIVAALVLAARQPDPRKLLIGEAPFVFVGRYVHGLPGAAPHAGPILCGLTTDYLVFAKPGWKELARVSRAAVNDVSIGDAERITGAVGVGNIGAITSAKSCRLALDWNDARGERWVTVFELQGSGAVSQANAALTALRSHLPPPSARLRVDEKKCPACAETIKAEARVCRFCSTSLAPSAG